MERPRYLEDYEIGESRETYGRTITETDFVVHAGHTGTRRCHPAPTASCLVAGRAEPHCWRRSTRPGPWGAAASGQ